MADDNDFDEFLKIRGSPDFEEWLDLQLHGFREFLHHYQYILDEDRRPIPEPNMVKYAVWMSSHDRIVAKDYVGDVEISTVFLGLNTNYMSDGPPIVFETMIFGGDHDHKQMRYSTWEDAERGHRVMVELVKRVKMDPDTPVDLGDFEQKEPAVEWPDDLGEYE